MPNQHIRFPILRRLSVTGHALFPGKEGEGLNWQFEPGVTVIAGINGIGKTTLLNLIYRMLVGPYDPYKDDNGIQITRTRLVKVPVFRYFSKRDSGQAANSLAFAEFDFGGKTLSLTRRLSDLAINSIIIDGEAINLENDDFKGESAISDLSGCASRYDFHVVVRTLLFFMEQKTPVVWDPSAQAEIFRILFLDAKEAFEFAQMAARIQKMDSDRRNKFDQLRKYKNQFEKFNQRSSVATEVVSRCKEIDDRIGVIENVSEALEDEADQIENDRDEGLQKLDSLKLDVEEATRKVEHLHHHYFASLFPRMPDTAKNVFTNLVSDNGCLVCGNREPELSEQFRKIAEGGDCPICRSPKERQEHVFAVAEFGSVSIQHEMDRIANLKRTVEKLEIAVASRSDDYSEALRKRLQLHAEREELRKESIRLRGMLPPTAEEATQTENYIKFTEKEISSLHKDIQSEMEAYKVKAAFFRSEVELLRANLTGFFEEYAGSFLAEICYLTFDPRKLSLGQATEKVEFPTFAVQMTSAVSPSNGTTRIDPDDVSESQKEFVDLAFRMAVLKTYAVATNGVASAMIVIETPEASLDSVFIGNAGKMLREWCHPTQNGTNCIIATSNLNRENMISALLGLRLEDNPKPDANEVKKRVVNLLEISAENAALRLHRRHYETEFDKSTSPEVLNA